MDDEINELKHLQSKAIDLHTAAIHTARHRPESASVVGGWAHEADLELMRFCKGKGGGQLQIATETTSEKTAPAEDGA